MTNLLLVVLRVYLSTNEVTPDPIILPDGGIAGIYQMPVNYQFTNYVIGVRLSGTNSLELLTASKKGPAVSR